MFWKSKPFLYHLQLLFYKGLCFLAGPILRPLWYTLLWQQHTLFLSCYFESISNATVHQVQHIDPESSHILCSPHDISYTYGNTNELLFAFPVQIKWELFTHSSSLAISGVCAEPSVFSAGALTLLTLPSGAHSHVLLLLASVTQPLKAPLPFFQGGMIWRSVSFGLTAIICGCQSENRNWNENNQCSLLCSRPVTVTFSWLYLT